MMGDDSIDYFEKRAEEEQEAAECATSEAARKVHVALADEYAARADKKRGGRTLHIAAK